MGLTLVRVDDRLIHGQVVAVWLKERDAKRIIVVDDPTAADAFLREVLELAAPRGVEVEVHDVESGAARLKSAARDAEPAFVLLRSPLSALRLRRAGVQFDVLNVGGLGAGPGRRRIHRTISASPEEIEALQELERLGTRVELQAVPSDSAVRLGSLAVEARR